MNCTLTEPRIAAYRRRGFLVVDDLLDAAELAAWRAAVAERVTEAGLDAAEDEDYYRNVFTQCVNLWKSNVAVGELIFDSPLGRMAAELAGVDSIPASTSWTAPIFWATSGSRPTFPAPTWAACLGRASSSTACSLTLPDPT